MIGPARPRTAGSPADVYGRSLADGNPSRDLWPWHTAPATDENGGMWIDERGSQVLMLPECRRLLALGAKQRRHGHLGISQQGAPVVLPLDYAVIGPDVVLRTGEGLFERMSGRLVAFQVDGVDREQAWSVLVQGLAIEEDPASLGNCVPTPEVAEPGHRFVRIRSDAVTGRRLGPKPATIQ